MRTQARAMLVPVFFRSAHGGLHNHVQAQIAAARGAGWQVTLLCKPGPFAETMSRTCRVAHTDFEDIDAATAVALAAGPYDLVHTHPWASARVAEKVAAALRIPVAVTHHNAKLDQLHRTGDRMDMVVAVSDFARRTILEASGLPPERVVVIPNGVDRGVFRPSRTRGPARDNDEVLVATRFDKDKGFVIELLEETFAAVARDPDPWRDVDWTIFGDGTEIGRVHDAANMLNEAMGRQRVRFPGWGDAKTLARAMRRASVVVAPGRSALEALACGAVTVAIGGRGYLGLLDGRVALAGMAQNFGSTETGWHDYAPGTLLRDVAEARRPTERSRRRTLGLAIADHYDQTIVDAQHQRFWEVLVRMPPRAAERGR